MRNFICLLGFLMLLGVSVSAQDEGTIVKRERIARNKGVFIGLGPSFTLGKNIGDYSTGFNTEVGFLKRVNRVISIGPSLSYISFNYDPEETGLDNIFIGGPYESGDGEFYLGALIDFKGGDISLTSLAFNLKVNFVPVMDDSKVSIYGFVKPFVTMASRTAVKGEAIILENDFDPEVAEYWYQIATLPWETDEELGIEVSDKLKADTEITGGILVGPGLEFAPARSVSFYAQALFGYTFPITYVSTEAYKGESLDTLSEEFPMTKKGFPSVNLQFGVSFNF
jgi:hypothetical protein